jgi:hypothetical protein
MLHHAEPKLFYCLMHMFELFEFEFKVCLNLNSKEKTKIKRIRNSKTKKENQRSPAALPPRPSQTGPLTDGPHLSAPRPARSPPLSARWGRLIDALACCVLTRCVAVTRAPLGSPSPLLQPSACTHRAHACRNRRAHIPSQRETATRPPFQVSACSHFPLPH